jgi:hypothetical protein
LAFRGKWVELKCWNPWTETGRKEGRKGGREERRNRGREEGREDGGERKKMKEERKEGKKQRNKERKLVYSNKSFVSEVPVRSLVSLGWAEVPKANTKTRPPDL